MGSETFLAQGLGSIGFIGFIGFLGFIGCLGFTGFIGFIGFIGFTIGFTIGFIIGVIMSFLRFLASREGCNPGAAAASERSGTGEPKQARTKLAPDPGP